MIEFNFDKENGHPTAFIRGINGSNKKDHSFILMIDTGSSRTALSYNSGKVLGFKYNENEKMHFAKTANNYGIPYVLRRIDLWIGNKLLKSFEIAWFLDEGDNYLGCDILDYFKVIFDKKADKITFIPSGQ